MFEKIVDKGIKAQETYGTLALSYLFHGPEVEASQM